MNTTIDAARTRAHLSRRERMAVARTEAFSRRTAATPPPPLPMVAMGRGELELIEQLVRHGRTVVSSALLVVAGIGAGEPRRNAVLTEVGNAASTARAEGTISSERRAQIARHLGRALEERERRIAA
jgi:hypothetical protein